MRRLKIPYRRTHTITFGGCDPEKLLSPGNGDTGSLKRMFSRGLRKAGFTITKHPTRRTLDIVCRPFGEGYGYTMIAVLSESHASFHMYPEAKFGVVAELEFNLCYLSKDHMPCVHKAIIAFSFHLPRSLASSLRERLLPG
jgi:S-adenosylmethionine/arginine decarboxylase-like enzyme